MSTPQKCLTREGQSRAEAVSEACWGFAPLASPPAPEYVLGQTALASAPVWSLAPLPQGPLGLGLLPGTRENAVPRAGQGQSSMLRVSPAALSCQCPEPGQWPQPRPSLCLLDEQAPILPAPSTHGRPLTLLHTPQPWPTSLPGAQQGPREAPPPKDEWSLRPSNL